MDQPLEHHLTGFADLLSLLPGFGFRCRQDASLSALWISEGVKAVTGYSAAAFLQDDMSLGELLLPADQVDFWTFPARGEVFDRHCGIRTRREGLRSLWLRARSLEHQGTLCFEGWALDLGLAPSASGGTDTALLGSLLDALPDAVYYTDLDCRILGCNRAFTEFAGLAAEDIIGRLSYELEMMHKRREEQLQEMAIVAAGGSVQQDVDLMHRGELRHFELIKVPYRSENQVLGLIAIGRDITTRRRQKAALEHSAEDFRQLLENMPVPVLVTRKHDRGAPYLNAAFSEHFGWESEDIPDIGTWCQLSFPDPEYCSRMLAEIAADMATLSPEHPRGAPLKLWISCKNGQRRLVEGTASLIGERILITYHDITEVKQAEDALRESEARTRQMLDAVPAGIFVVDHRGQAVYANRRAKLITGRGVRLTDPAFRPEQADQTYFTPDGQPYPFERLPLVRALQGEAAESADIQLWQGADAIPLEIKASPIRDEQGRISHAVAVFEDISERQRRERELIEAREKAEDASRAKGEFLANMSHEIRTPLHAIIGLNQLLLRTGLEARQLDYVRNNQQAARNLLGILNDILDMSKIEAGMLHLERTAFELNDVLGNLFNLLSWRAQEKSLELVVNIDEALPAQLIGDPLRLEQVLVNLVGNAIKFTPAGEVSLAVSLQAQDEHSVQLKFDVRDTGIGISETEGASLFQAFSQADGSTTRNYGGTGLGLSISRVLVGLMGGQIGFTSVPGEGSCFYFEARFGCKQTALAVSHQLPLDLSQKRVLVIDDHQIVLDILDEYLRRFGLQPDTWLAAPDNLPELQKLSQGPAYDLLLVDWRLPGLDPGSLVKNFGRHHPAPQLVLMTAATPDELPQDALPADFKRILHKPITPSQLYNLFGDLFGNAHPPAVPDSFQDSYFQDLLAPLQGTRLLLVEDHPINQRVARELLEGYGFVVDIAANGVEALQTLAQQPTDYYALILMDLQMPVMDGFEATRQIRAQARFRKLPILAMTADAIEGVKARTLEAGMDDYLTKPIDLDLLLGKLHRWLHQAQAEKQSEQAPEKPAALPVLPGIDLKSALRRTGGNRSLYLDLLRECARLMSQQRLELAQAIADSDSQQTISLAHAIRGAAANLGLVEIADSMASLEHALKSGDAFQIFWQAGQAAIDDFDKLLPQLNVDSLGPV